MIGKGLKIVENRFYTVYKIKKVLRKMMTVQEVMYINFNLQATKT